MKRREFSKALTGLLLPLTPALVRAEGFFKAGQHYRVLDRPAPVDAPAGKIEVLEFFSYNCGHCNAFEPQFDAWVRKGAPKDAIVRRVPVPFVGAFKPLQHMFYALEAMDQLDKLHARVYRAIHVERVPLADPGIIADWVARQGVDKTLFMNHFNSFTVAGKVQRAGLLTSAYQVEGVPTLGIGGRYITDQAMAGGSGSVLRVAEQLIARVRDGR